MTRLVHAVGFSVLLYVVPLLATPDRLLDPRTWFLLAACWVTFWTQPAPSLREAADRHGEDRLSYVGILLAGAAGQWVALLDWAWRRPAVPLRDDLPWVVAGGVLVVGGLAFRIWAIRVLGEFFTTTVRVRAGQAVVRGGPYRLVRHPSYLGALVGALGGAVLLHSVPGMIAVVVLMGIAYAWRITVEERALARELGDAYAAYRREVRARLVPGLW